MANQENEQYLGAQQSDNAYTARYLAYPEGQLEGQIRNALCTNSVGDGRPTTEQKLLDALGTAILRELRTRSGEIDAAKGREAGLEKHCAELDAINNRVARKLEENEHALMHYCDAFSRIEDMVGVVGVISVGDLPAYVQLKIDSLTAKDVAGNAEDDYGTGIVGTTMASATYPGAIGTVQALANTGVVDVAEVAEPEYSMEDCPGCAVPVKDRVKLPKDWKPGDPLPENLTVHYDDEGRPFAHRMAHKVYLEPVDNGVDNTGSVEPA